MSRRSPNMSAESPLSHEEDDQKTPSIAEKVKTKAKEIWTKTGLDIPTIQMMIK